MLFKVVLGIESVVEILKQLDDVLLIKFADDSTLLITVSEHADDSDMALLQFLNWIQQNDMKCNASKCKELVFRKNAALSIILSCTT